MKLRIGSISDYIQNKMFHRLALDVVVAMKKGVI